MKRFQLFLPILFLFIFLIGCNDDDDDNNNEVPVNLEIENFIWKGLNLFYLWQDDIPDLSDQRFTSQEQLNDFLKGYATPEDLFYSLLNDYPNTDKYSWIVDDYLALEDQFQGISGSNGVEFGLVYESGSNTDIFGYVRYIIPNSDASGKNIERGSIFHAVNGTPLTANNYRQLLFGTESYTLNLADYNNGNPTDNGISVSLTKSEIQENPIHATSTVDDSGKKIGYLMYNSFNTAFETELNAAFASLKADGITDLVLDLRYNPGGSTRTSLYLAGMITGQFTGELFSQENWNTKWQDYFLENDPNSIKNLFVDKMHSGENLNSLNLDNIVIITTGSTASASELIINGLNPYINVTTIGTTTEGKTVGSVTVYDSENYRREGANPNHFYAMQPLVLEISNKLGENNINGIDPSIELPEDYGNMGVLGDPTDPLYDRAIQFITTGSKLTQDKLEYIHHEAITDTKRELLSGSNMYIERELPILK